MGLTLTAMVAFILLMTLVSERIPSTAEHVSYFGETFRLTPKHVRVYVTVTYTFEKEFVVVVRLLLKPPRRSTGRRDGNEKMLRMMFVLQNPH